MVFMGIMFAVFILSFMWDSRGDAKNDALRERMLCDLDRHRSNEIELLKREIEHLKQSK